MLVIGIDRALTVLSGRSRLTVSSIFTLAAVFGVGTLAKAAGAGHWRRHYLGFGSRGGISLEIASCCSRGAIFIFSGTMEAI